MDIISAAEAHDNTEPQAIMSQGQADAIMPSLVGLEGLTARRRGAKAGFAKHLFVGIDLNGPLGTSLDDVFKGYR